MTRFRVEPAASAHLDDIYDYTADRWGEDQADLYIRGLFDRFAEIAARRRPWRRIPADYQTDGFYCSHERHYIYWKLHSDVGIAIVLLLHERMSQPLHVRHGFEGAD